jgi:integrase
VLVCPSRSVATWSVWPGVRRPGPHKARGRRWRQACGGAQRSRLDEQVSPITAAKAYRLMKTIMTTAADDGAIRRNPCRIKGGGAETSAERTVLTVSQVFGLSETVEPRYRALVLLAAFTGLRWGELCALRRSDIDGDARIIRVERTLTELHNGRQAFGPPKTAAGRRLVGFPELIVPVVRWHLSCFAEPEENGLVFVGPAGALLRRQNFRQRVWLPALSRAGLPAVHFHDLRHTGNNLTAGANLRELMARMGHSSTRAALIYLHSTADRQREIADALGALAVDELKRSSHQAQRTTGQRLSRASADRARNGHGAGKVLREDHDTHRRDSL